MPLVRIFHPAGHDRSYSSALSKGVHRALVSAFGVPEDDFFQIITEHQAGTGLLSPETFLGIAHSADLVIVQITCAEGRTADQKKALFSAIAGNLGTDAGVPEADVVINLIETRRENWPFGNGEAQFAQQEIDQR